MRGGHARGPRGSARRTSNRSAWSDSTPRRGPRSGRARASPALVQAATTARLPSSAAPHRVLSRLAALLSNPRASRRASPLPTPARAEEPVCLREQTCSTSPRRTARKARQTGVRTSPASSWVFGSPRAPRPPTGPGTSSRPAQVAYAATDAWACGSSPGVSAPGNPRQS